MTASKQSVSGKRARDLPADAHAGRLLRDAHAAATLAFRPTSACVHFSDAHSSHHDHIVYDQRLNGLAWEYKIPLYRLHVNMRT